jgi:PST family polysaccharide transporter
MGKHVGRSMAWVLLSFAASKLVGVVLTVALGYILLPEQMGVWAATLGFFGFMQSCRDAGVATLLVQRGEKEYEDLVGPAYWLSTAFHVFCAALAVLIGLGVAQLSPDKRDMGHTLMLCSLAMLAMAPATMAQARLRMKLKFQAIAAITSISAVIRAGVILSCAWAGLGAISFVLGLFALAAFESIAMSRATGEKMWKHPAQPHRWRDILWTVRWNLALAFGFSTLAVGDWAALSFTASPAVIGIYYFGVQLMMQAEQAISGTASQVLFPSFATIKDDAARLSAALLRTLRALSLVASPICVCLAALADPLIRLVWPTGRWDESIMCLTALSALVSFRICMIAPISALQAQGRFRATFFCVLTMGVSLFLSALVGSLAFHTPLAIALCTGATVGPVSLLVSLLVSKRVGLPRRQALDALVRPWLIAAIVGAVVFVLDRELVRLALGESSADAPPRWAHLARLLAGGVLFCGLYAIAARVALASSLRDALAVAPAKVRGVGERVLRLRASSQD